MITSVTQKFADYENEEDVFHRTELLYELQDEIVAELSGLITDVVSGKAPKKTLIAAIELRISEKKGVENPSSTARLILDNIYGYGWLQDYIEDPDITDIDVLRYDCVMVRSFGKYRFIESEFTSERQLERFCKFVVIRSGGNINESQPHCRVADTENKLRINVCIAPRNATGPSLTIRKHSDEARSLEDLLDAGMLTKQQFDQLEESCKKQENILICGKGAAGKTTLLRAIIDRSDPMERILICEKDAEIFPSKKNCIVQRITKNRDEASKIDLNTLIEEGLTMSLDTYCIGEITGQEAWPLVKAGFSDHRTLATIHAKSAGEAVDRMLMLCTEQSRLSESVIQEMIEKSVDIIIYLREFKIEEMLRIG